MNDTHIAVYWNGHHVGYFSVIDCDHYYLSGEWIPLETPHANEFLAEVAEEREPTIRLGQIESQTRYRAASVVDNILNLIMYPHSKPV